MPALTESHQIALRLRQPDSTASTSLGEGHRLGHGPSSPASQRSTREFSRAVSCATHRRVRCVGTLTALDAPDESALTIAARVGRRSDDRRRRLARTSVRRDRRDVHAVAVQQAEYWHNPEDRAHRSSATDGAYRRPGYKARRGASASRGAQEMFIRGGYNVYPSRREGALTHPKVAEVAIVPRADDVIPRSACGRRPGRPHDPPTLDELRTHGAVGLARYKLPNEFHRRRDAAQTPPTNSTGAAGEHEQAATDN